MDRHLVAGAVLLLILEIAFLAIDLGTGDSWTAPPRQQANQIRIGEIHRTENQVRRRNQSSLVWSESTSRDVVFEYDSVLTLKDSTARIELRGESILSLDENTLVVLEPDDRDASGSIRIRFAKGTLRSKNPLQPLTLQTSTWTVEAVQGTQLSLVGLEDGKFELELEQGSAKLKGPDGEQQSVTGGERVRLSRTSVESKTAVATSIRWSEDIAKRVYAREFPIQIDLPWAGDAETMEIVTPEKAIETVPVAGKSRWRLAASRGTYVLRLQNGSQISASFTLQVRESPPMRYFTPLPRDRARTSTDLLFSWEPIDGLKGYRVELSPSLQFSNDVLATDSTGAQAKVVVKQAGSFYWRVIGRDADGYEIPAPRAYPLFTTPDPLDAPELHTPEIRQPASPDSDKKDGASWLFDLFLPPARAETSQLQAMFTWAPVAGADHYVIEISRTPGFEEPLVIQKARETKYIWRGFKIGNYFWRVAAGRSASSDRPEQLGLFSAAALARLDPRFAEAGKGVVLLAPAPTENKPVSSVSSPVQPELHGPPKPPETPTVAEAKSEEPPSESLGDPEWLRHADPRRLSWRVLASPRYAQVSSKTVSNTNSSFQGFVPFAIDADLTILAQPQRRFETSLTYQETQWKPTKSVSPFQRTLKEKRVSADAFYRPRARVWALGLSTESVSFFSRTAPEAGTFSEKWLYGPAARLLWLSPESELDLRIAARIGAGWTGARVSLAWNYSAWKNDRMRTWLSPFATAAYLTGTGSQTWQELALGLRIGAGF